MYTKEFDIRWSDIDANRHLANSAYVGMFFKFVHNFYDYKGRNLARGSMIGGWIDLTTRKMRGLPEKS